MADRKEMIAPFTKEIKELYEEILDEELDRIFEEIYTEVFG